MKLENNKLYLTEDEVKYIVECEESEDGKIELVEEIVGESRRWVTSVEAILEVEVSEGNFRYFSVVYDKGNTENQPNMYEGGWFKEVEKREITTHKWVVIEEGVK